jgi:hypothetical protein
MADERGGGGERPGSSPARSPARYSLLVGLAFLALVIVATVNTLGTDSGGVLGTDEQIRGQPLPEFAVPRIPGQLEGDANVAQDDCETAENPCPADAQRTPACEIDAPGALRVCDFFDRPLVISFWFTDPSGCPPTQDAVDAVAKRFEGRVNFLSVAIRGDHDEIQSIVEDHGWSVPVGWDRDGAVSNIYRVGVCPTVAFAFPGGEFESATVGADNLDAPALTRDVQHLLRLSTHRAETDR